MKIYVCLEEEPLIKNGRSIVTFTAQVRKWRWTHGRFEFIGHYGRKFDIWPFKVPKKKYINIYISFLELQIANIYFLPFKPRFTGLFQNEKLSECTFL